MTQTLEMSVQEQLFPSQDLVAQQHELMRGFLAEELIGIEFSETDEGVFKIVDDMAIAAECLARTIAESRGDIDPESPAFLQETIVGRLNAEGARGPFLFDVDYDIELKDVEVVDMPTIDRLNARALELAQTIINEVRFAQIISQINKEN